MFNFQDGSKIVDPSAGSLCAPLLVYCCISGQRSSHFSGQKSCCAAFLFILYCVQDHMGEKPGGMGGVTEISFLPVHTHFIFTSETCNIPRSKKRAISTGKSMRYLQVRACGIYRQEHAVSTNLQIQLRSSASVPLESERGKKRVGGRGRKIG